MASTLLRPCSRGLRCSGWGGSSSYSPCMSVSSLDPIGVNLWRTNRMNSTEPVVLEAIKFARSNPKETHLILLLTKQGTAQGPLDLRFSLRPLTQGPVFPKPTWRSSQTVPASRACFSLGPSPCCAPPDQLVQGFLDQLRQSHVAGSTTSNSLFQCRCSWPLLVPDPFELHQQVLHLGSTGFCQTDGGSFQLPNVLLVGVRALLSVHWKCCTWHESKNSAHLLMKIPSQQPETIACSSDSADERLITFWLLGDAWRKAPFKKWMAQLVDFRWLLLLAQSASVEVSNNHWDSHPSFLLPFPNSGISSFMPMFPELFK